MSDGRQSLTSTHWGTYAFKTDKGRLQSLQPYDQDPDRSSLGESLCGAIDGALRIRQQMIRRGWLERGAGEGQS